MMAFVLTAGGAELQIRKVTVNELCNLGELEDGTRE
jgi:hypothetical protein